MQKHKRKKLHIQVPEAMNVTTSSMALQKHFKHIDKTGTEAIIQ
jgi:hypothetical protein